MTGTPTPRRRVLVLGNFSGRNVGDIAILGNVLSHLGRACPGTEFLVPTLRPAFVRRRFPAPNVRPIGVAPWHGSIKFLGIPMIRAIRAADLVLITDALLFDRGFFNPMHNYLSTLALLAPWCRRRGTPMMIYHGSLGPISTSRGAWALGQVLAACRVSVLRDRSSRALVEQLGVATDPVPSGDVTRLRARLDLEEGAPWLGWNVSPYLQAWQDHRGRAPHRRFAAIMAGVLDRVVRERGVRPVLAATQRMDLGLSAAVREAMREGADCRIIDATALDYREAAGLLGSLQLVVAMRTHALVLAAAGGAPVFNINTYPKSSGFMESIRQQRCQHELSSLQPEELAAQVVSAWDDRAALRRLVRREVSRERPSAYAGVPIVQRLLGMTPGRPTSERRSGVHDEAQHRAY
jgi:polysaccharide pyruvyl transferase WcaK-like protein